MLQTLQTEPPEWSTPPTASHLLNGCFWKPRQMGGRRKLDTTTLSAKGIFRKKGPKLREVRLKRMRPSRALLLQNTHTACHPLSPYTIDRCNVFAKAQSKAGGTQIQCCQGIEASWRFWLQVWQLFSMDHLHCNAFKFHIPSIQKFVLESSLAIRWWCFNVFDFWEFLPNKNSVTLGLLVMSPLIHGPVDLNVWKHS